MFQDTEAKRQMRVAIANDVLDMIDLQLVKVEQSYGYVVSHDTFTHKLGEFLSRLNPRATECTVCALGAGIISAARMGQISALETSFSRVSDLDYEDIFITLQEFFSSAQLEAIEVAFEGVSSLEFLVEPNITEELEDKLAHAALVMFNAYEEEPAYTLLRAIWQNVADNRGTFIP